ncbi:hypothetical protein H920_12347 [Fukomys damarensis]|uniref:Uncharacterized protein n=1 Tax=Fukomys damarensis TaxID=885580 RepID=A0A091D7J2_FUKDA|nr:hypothetical protein H920_12347 [Fukomys damarensis]
MGGGQPGVLEHIPETLRPPSPPPSPARAPGLLCSGAVPSRCPPDALQHRQTGREVQATDQFHSSGRGWGRAVCPERELPQAPLHRLHFRRCTWFQSEPHVCLTRGPVPAETHPPGVTREPLRTPGRGLLSSTAQVASACFAVVFWQRVDHRFLLRDDAVHSVPAQSQECSTRAEGSALSTDPLKK